MMSILYKIVGGNYGNAIFMELGSFFYDFVVTKAPNQSNEK